MNKFKFIHRAKSFVTRHSPEILVGLGVTGMIGTTVLAVKATPKALKLIEEKKAEERTDKLTPIETVKTTWKCYAPAAVMCVSSAACIIGASSVHIKRNAALATAYKLSETALSEYRDAVVETVGERKEHSIQDALDVKRIKKASEENNEVIMTNCGKTLCLDPTSGRFFESDIDHIRKAENELNKQMLHDMFGYASLNDFYDALDLPHTDVGDMIGWNVHNLIDIRIGSGIAPDGRPCIVVNHNHSPAYEYDRVS